MATGARDDSKHSDAATSFNPSTVDEASATAFSAGGGAGDGEGVGKNVGWQLFWKTSRPSPEEGESRRRHRAEMYLAHFFLETVTRNGREIVSCRRSDPVRAGREDTAHDGGAASMSRFADGEVSSMPAALSPPATAKSVSNDLTEDEQEIFRRTAYYGWTEGAAAGLATFGVLFGGLRWAAARRAGGGGGLGRTRDQLAMMPPPPRRGYQQLDGIAARRRPALAASVPYAPTPSVSSSSSSATSSSAPLLGASDDVMVQLQFMCIGAMSLVVGTLVAQNFTDRERLFRQVERVPLLPGRSVLCHRMCPDLMKQHRDLLGHNSWEQLIYGRGEASTDEGETFEGASSRVSSSDRRRPATRFIPPPGSYVPDYTPADLLKDPETPELESIVHLLQNCQARIRYGSQLRDANRMDRGVRDDDDDESIVTIPPPGVPPSAIANDNHTIERP